MMLTETQIKCTRYAQCKTLLLLDLSGLYNPKFSAVQLCITEAANN